MEGGRRQCRGRGPHPSLFTVSRPNERRGDLALIGPSSVPRSSGKILFMRTTRFGPNRPVADMEGNEEFDFWVI